MKTEERDAVYIGQLYLDAKKYLMLALEGKSLSADHRARSYCMLAKIYDEFENDPFTAYDFCCRSIQRRDDYIEVYRVRMQIGRALAEGGDNSYKEKAKANLSPDEEKLHAFATIQQITASVDHLSLEQVNVATLRQMLVKYFDDSELRDICFDLSIDYEDIQGQGKRDKARELVAYVERRGRTAELMMLCRRLRPNADWQSVAQTSPP